MRVSSVLRNWLLVTVVLVGARGAWAQAQEAPSQDATNEAERKGGMPARTAPSEYQAQSKAGMVTVAAEFMGHSVPTPETTYITDDYVVVEVGLFGPPEARAKLSASDFSLRIDGRKMPSPNQPFEVVFRSLKDPEWEPLTKDDTSSKTSLSTGGGQGDFKPAPPKMPPELRRAMNLRVQKTTMLEGDRALPQAGLLFFEYRGKPEKIRSLELIYSGSAGNTVVRLHP